MFQALPIGGLRLGLELTQIRVCGLPIRVSALTDYLAILDSRRINLSFLSLWMGGAYASANLCVAARQREQALQAALRFPDLVPHLTVLSPVCTLSVFPHRNDLALLHRALAALQGVNVPLLALGTSVSAVTCVVAESRLLDALPAFEAAFALPDNHAPIRLQLRHEPVLRGEDP